jgi:hypothetical protein
MMAEGFKSFKTTLLSSDTGREASGMVSNCRFSSLEATSNIMLVRDK